ncbi:hypothetical protein ACM26V_03735 [Salipaludibacillus sp. HK11]|uniref:hypothetical protein n=1 Tax=Salipaludibacillus sp. HK11 TaxID=3394320 RepID=UPI0039FD5293
MIKKYYKQISYGLSIVILLFFLNIQYQEKKMYEEHISQKLNSDIHRITISLVNNYNTYGEILDSGKVTKRQASLLRDYNRDIVRITDEYERIAVNFNHLNNANFNNETLNNAQKISSFWGSITNWEDYFDELDETLIVLDSELTEIIEYLWELHVNWLKAAEKNISGVSNTNNHAKLDGLVFNSYYGKDSISKSFWIDLIVDLDDKTTIFLNDYEIANIEEILNN